MDTKKLTLSTLAATVVLFLLGFLWYGMLMADFYASNGGGATDVGKDPLDMWALILGILIISCAMAYLFPKWSRGANNAKQGFIFGALIGLITGFGTAFITYGTSNFMNMTGTIVDGIFNIVQKGLAGIVIALVYGRGKE